MDRTWTALVQGSKQIEVPSQYFIDLIGQFESKLKKYTQQLFEMEKIQMSKNEQQEDQDEFEKLYQVMALLNQNILIVAD